MKSFLLFFTLLFGLYSSLTINVGNCSELQNMTVNNSTIIYNITQNLVCNQNFTMIGDQNSAFLGTIEGNFFNISGLRIISASSYVGIFAYGKSCAVRNLNFKNLTIDQTVKNNSASLFAFCENCNSKFFFFNFFSKHKKFIKFLL